MDIRKSFEDEVKRILKFDDIIKLLIDDFNWLASEGKKKNRSDEQIEVMQELYVRQLIIGFLNSLDIPKAKKIELLEKVKEKLK